MLEEKTRWKHVQEVLQRPDFKSRVLSLDPHKVPERAIAVAEQLSLGNQDLSHLLQIKQLGVFPSIIAVWTVAMLRVLAEIAAQKK